MIAALIGELQVAEIALILLGVVAVLAALGYVKAALDHAPSDVERTHAEYDALEAAIAEDRARRGVTP